MQTRRDPMKINSRRITPTIILNVSGKLLFTIINSITPDIKSTMSVIEIT
jgi:hypothetical protein